MSDQEHPDILVVDDDAANLVAIEAALGELGRRLVKATSGPEALRCLLQQDFALILLDVQMPSMDGFETAQLIRSRSRNQHVPIIFITAYSRDDEAVLKGYELGAVDFLFKPIVPEMLRAKASVFVELQRRTAEVARQAELLHEHERRELERRLASERQQWEADALRRRMEQEREAAAAMARKAEELALTVAERERAERELTRINQHLEETDRRKDEFLAMLAHELRNPLAPIVTSLELIRAQPVHDPIIDRARDAMERQVHQLRRLVDDLLDVSRITSGKIELCPKPVSLEQVVDLAISTSRPLIDERHHELVVERPQADVVVEGDLVRLTQVVSNLLNNAARYSEQPGRITVQYGCDDDAVFIAVSDRGRGIEPDMLRRIFDVFVQASTGGGGLGLGLTLVQRIVAMHGGTVSAFSDGLGKGSRFEVRLPKSVIREASALKAEPKPFENREKGDQLRIVVIEDNEDIRDMVTLLLEEWGHDVRVAENGRSGIELVCADPPDVALIDIGMPDMDGYEVARELRRQMATDCPRLVAVTGFGQPRERELALEAGFDAHIVKPATAASLRQALAGE